MIRLLGVLYILVALGLALYGLTGFLTLWLYLRHKNEPSPQVAPLQPADAPKVTVQLPVYNEPLVIERLIDAAVALDYPADKLQIQVLDDSNDETTILAQARVALHRERGHDIVLIHRDEREGYKAGALQQGLDLASGDMIAIFDADFIPAPEFLCQTIPHFVERPLLGMVQTRWGHLNANYTALTRAQAISLDKHFAIEQVVRHRAKLFPKFNGSGGVWRVDCARESGGWSADTVCEDLDLSTRAQLDGWQFLFLPEAVSPAELPPQMTAFKTQQARWAKGSLQCTVKFWRSILKSEKHSWLGKTYALISMSGYLAHPLLVALLLLLPLLLLTGYEFSPLMAWFGIAGVAQPLIFVLSQQALYTNWQERTLKGLPALVLVAVGLAPSNTWSIWEAVSQRNHVFYRTPKFNLLPQQDGRWGAGLVRDHFRIQFHPLILAEMALALYALFGAGVAVMTGMFGSLPFMFLCAIGFAYTAVLSWSDVRHSY